MKQRILNIVISVLTVLCLTFGGAIAENADAQPADAAQTEAVQEESVSESETAAAAETTETAATEQTSSENKVEDPDFAGTSDPLSTIRLVLAAVGAFAIAFMYSHNQHSKNRARNKKK